MLEIKIERFFGVIRKKGGAFYIQLKFGIKEGYNTQVWEYIVRERIDEGLFAEGIIYNDDPEYEASVVKTLHSIFESL